MKDDIFHPEKVSYTVERKYEPDFQIDYNGGTYLIEYKGFFRDGPEASKYTWIRDVLPEDTELLFIFEKPTKPIHFRTKRSDGSKMTHGEWATKNNFRYFSVDSFVPFYKQIDKKVDS